MEGHQTPQDRNTSVKEMAVATDTGTAHLSV
jgi:hypothetical protein